MADIFAIAKDPEFQKLPIEEQQKAFAEMDPDFATLPPEEQLKGVREATGVKETPQPQEDVPEWGRKNPNLYGLYGAGRAVARAGIEGVGAGLGAAGGTAVAGPAGGIGGAGLGYAGSKRLADFALGKEQGEGPDSLKKFATDTALGAAFQIPGAALASRPIRSAISALPSKLPKVLYESGMKFSNNPKVLSPVDRRHAIQTGIEGGYLPNEKSYDRLWQTVAGNKSKVNSIIDKGDTAGDVIDTSRALRPLDNIKKRFDRVRNQHPELSEAVDDVYARYSQTPTIGVKDAQTLKETLQDIASFATDDRSKATNRAYKAVGRGLRIELERLYPDLAKINKESAALLTLENELAKAVGRVGNRDITSLGLRVALSGAPSPASTANTIMSIFEMPRIKSRLAVMLYKAQTGKNVPVSQWRKIAGQVMGPAALGAKGGQEQADRDMSQLEEAVLLDPLGIRQ